MATGLEPRCADCLDEFSDGDQRFIVFKPEDPIWDADVALWRPAGREDLVCRDCVGWYRESVELEAV